MNMNNTIEKIIMKTLGIALGIGVTLSMRFCDSIKETLKNIDFNKIKEDLKDFNKKLEKTLGLKDTMMYIIGSGSSFEFLYNCDYEHAYEEYKKMSIFYCTGTRVDKAEAYHSLLEQYHCMESNSGYVYCYILPINKMRDLGIKFIENEENKND